MSSAAILVRSIVRTIFWILVALTVIAAGAWLVQATIHLYFWIISVAYEAWIAT